jgi:hypothetical protein
MFSPASWTSLGLVFDSHAEAGMTHWEASGHGAELLVVTDPEWDDLFIDASRLALTLDAADTNAQGDILVEWLFLPIGHPEIAEWFRDQFSAYGNGLPYETSGVFDVRDGRVLTSFDAVLSRVALAFRVSD